MPFLLEFGKDGRVRVEDLDSHTETPCPLCISGIFRLGYAVHDECLEAFNKMSVEDKEKLRKMIEEENRKRREGKV